ASCRGRLVTAWEEVPRRGDSLGPERFTEHPHRLALLLLVTLRLPGVEEVDCGSVAAHQFFGADRCDPPRPDPGRSRHGRRAALDLGVAGSMDGSHVLLLSGGYPGKSLNRVTGGDCRAQRGALGEEET